MKKVLKIISFIVLGVLAAVYAGFLFVLPNVVDLNKYLPEIQKLVKEQAKVDLNIENVKIITTPLLGAGIKTGKIEVKLPDGSLLLSADGLKTRVSIPSIFVLTAKVSCLEIDNPLINLEIAEDNVDYKVVKLVEDILNEQKEKALGIEKPDTKEGFKFDPNWIRIKVPNVKINNYKVLVTDTKTKHYLDLHGEELRLGYFNGKTAKIKTYAELFSNDNRNLTAKIDVNTFLPKPQPGLDAEDDPAERIDIPFVNPVELYRNYNLKADFDTKLFVRNHKNGITAYGHTNIDNLTLKVSYLQLPSSYIHAKTFGSNLDLDTNIYPIENQNIQLLGKVNYSKHPALDMNIKTGNIQFNDLLILTRAFLDSLSIPHELAQINAEGSVNADCYIKTNFKKLKSNGYIKVQNGGLSVRNLGKVLSKANINILLDNNVLNIKDSSILVNNSKINVNGSIDEKSYADIKINADKISLPTLFNAFAPKDVRNAYNFSSGDVTLNLGVKGKLKKAIATAEFGLDNLNLSDRKNTFNIKNQKLTGTFSCDTKVNAIAGTIDNNGLSITLPATNSVVSLPKLGIEIADKNIMIGENEIYFNNKSKIKYSGLVTDFEKIKNIDFLAQGDIDTNDLIKLIGREFKPFINNSGVIPVKVTFNGNKKKQTLFAQALGDKDNFITPVEFTEIGGKNSSLQTVVDFKPNRIKIKKTGLYTRTVTADEKGNETISLDPILDVDGTIARDRINLIKVNIDKNLSGKIFAFPRSSLLAEKSKLYIFGASSNPRIRGTLNIREINIPELLMSINNINLHFAGHNLNFDVKDVLLNGSDISARGVLGTSPSPVLNVSSLNVTSRLINLDKILKVAELAQKYVPAGSNNKTNSSAGSVNIPVTVNNGSIDMRRILTGNIEVLNTVSRMSLDRNILYLNNLRTNIFKGRVNGDIGVNLISLLVNVDLKGENINVAKALLDGAGMKDMLSGTASFSAKLSINGAATTPEAQMKGIQGDVDFSVKNGQFGPFGKIENLIIAENIRESQFFQTALGGIINSLTSIDTTHFSELNGHISLKEGVCYLDPITSLGNTLTLHIFGEFDIIRNYADMKVRAKMSSIISKVLGPLNAINPINLMNSAASLNVVTAKAFSLFCEVVPESELAILPSFENGYIDSGAAKFQLKVRGDAAKPLTLVKSFKWLSSKSEYDEAVEFVNSLPEEVEGSTAANIEEAIAEAKALEEEKKTLKYKVRHLFSKESKKVEKKEVNNEANSSTEESKEKSENIEE